MNELRSNSFTFIFEKIPNVAYYTTDVPIPAVNLGQSIINSRSIDFNLPSGKLDFDPITITFNVDENLDNYLELYNWMLELGHPERSKINRPDDKDATSDAIVTILNNQKNPIFNIILKDCFPISLGELAFNTGAAEPIPCTATISYTWFEIVSLTT